MKYKGFQKFKTRPVSNKTFMIVGILMCCCDNLKVIRNRKNRSFYLLSTYEKKMDK